MWESTGSYENAWDVTTIIGRGVFTRGRGRVFYNWQRPHSEEAYAGYDPEKEQFQERDYKKKLQLKKLKRGL
jgi:hypothetical protein